MSAGERQLYALVDYDNQRTLDFGSRNRPGIGPNLRDHERNVFALARGLLSVRDDLFDHRVVEFHVRFYVGWFQDFAGAER